MQQDRRKEKTENNKFCKYNYCHAWHGIRYAVFFPPPSYCASSLLINYHLDRVLSPCTLMGIPCVLLLCCLRHSCLVWILRHWNLWIRWWELNSSMLIWRYFARLGRRIRRHVAKWINNVRLNFDVCFVVTHLSRPVVALQLWGKGLILWLDVANRSPLTRRLITNYHNLPQKIPMGVNSKIESARGTMGRGNLLPFPSCPARFLFLSPHKLRRREGSLHRGYGCVKIYCGPTVTKLSRDFVTYTDKKNHVVILIHAFRRNLKKLKPL